MLSLRPFELQSHQQSQLTLKYQRRVTAGPLSQRTTLKKCESWATPMLDVEDSLTGRNTGADPKEMVTSR